MYSIFFTELRKDLVTTFCTAASMQNSRNLLLNSSQVHNRNMKRTEHIIIVLWSKCRILTDSSIVRIYLLSRRAVFSRTSLTQSYRSFDWLRMYRVTNQIMFNISVSPDSKYVCLHWKYRAFEKDRTEGLCRRKFTRIKFEQIKQYA